MENAMKKIKEWLTDMWLGRENWLRLGVSDRPYWENDIWTETWMAKRSQLWADIVT